LLLIREYFKSQILSPRSH